MTKYEYHLLHIGEWDDQVVKKMLNELGEEGWLLVAIEQPWAQVGQRVLIFARLKS